jgi:hypothetical protein
MNARSGMRYARRIAFCTGGYGSNNLKAGETNERATLQRVPERDRVVAPLGLVKPGASTVLFRIGLHADARLQDCAVEPACSNDTAGPQAPRSGVRRPEVAFRLITLTTCPRWLDTHPWPAPDATTDPRIAGRPRRRAAAAMPSRHTGTACQDVPNTALD